MQGWLWWAHTGQKLAGAGGAVLTVVANRDWKPDGGVVVYNFQVEGDHTYFVGDVHAQGEWVWTHNACSVDATTFRGGLHGSTKGPIGDGLESHHMPARSVNGLPLDKGPAIQMVPSDHVLTKSHGSQSGSDLYRLRQERLVKKGIFGSAIQMDIDDVRNKFGGKYDEAIREMIAYLEPWMKKGLKG